MTPSPGAGPGGRRGYPREVSSIAPAAPPTDDAYGPPGRSAWLDVDWAAHRRWIEVDGRWVNVIDIGSGPPMIFLHGLSGCWQNWLENLPYFARGHRVIAFDRPGYPTSTSHSSAR